MPSENFIPENLDPSRINILSWNIQKLSTPQWQLDFKQLSNSLDLALFQEVHLGDPFLSCFDKNWNHSFAQGFSTRNRQTGVVTLASVQPLSHQPFSVCEPLIRTPKATNITTYGLTDADVSLLVINLHAINFSFGVGSYRQQLQQIERVIRTHEGPIIFAGDFNAWHPGRIRLLREFASQLELIEVPFEEDFRSRFMGHHLDYVFIRDLSIENAHTRNVISSDHNPMLASFRFNP